MAPADISQFRSEIDAIDDKIIALLNERSSIVKKVGLAKKNSQKKNICYIRSGREAEVIRRIYQKLKDGVFPAIASTQMWRMVICASLSLESTLNVSTLNTEKNSRLYWLVREYFGNFIPVSQQNSTQEVIEDVINNKVQVAALPVTGGWWATLPEDIKIFACIPFIIQQNETVEAFAVARLEPEETGDDITLLKIASANVPLDEETLLTAFTEASIIDHHKDAYLLECKGFIAPDSNILDDIRRKTGYTITPLGAYAAPLITN